MKNYTKTVISLILLAIGLNASGQIADKNLQKFQMAWNLINALYVDTINQEMLAETAIIEMLKKLDPHSVYISAKEVQSINEQLSGSFDGVGIEFHVLNDTLIVVNTISGGPSEKVGMMAGDRIIAVDDKPITNIKLKNSDVYKLLRGPKGTHVNLNILRKDKNISFKVTRDKIPIFSVDAAYMASQQTAYIKINRFAANTYEEFTTAINNLKKNNPKALILDLRGNGGGYLNAAIDISDEFLSQGKLIVFTEGINSPRQENRATSRGSFENGMVVVLIDESSASASEIVAGAIQDHDRGIVIGRRSFGKGLVQRQLNLLDGSQLRLTTSKYYTPSGRCIQKPYTDGLDAYNEDLSERFKNGEYMHSDSIDIDTSVVYKTLVNGRKMYGGGGITPDLFVAADTSNFTKYYRQLYAKAILNNTAFNFLDKQRSTLKTTYPTFEKFASLFTIDQALIQQMLKLAESEDIEFNETEYKQSEALIKTQLKAIIAKDLWNASAYFEILNPTINVYNEALKTINDKNKYNKLLQN